MTVRYFLALSRPLQTSNLRDSFWIQDLSRLFGSSTVLLALLTMSASAQEALSPVPITTAMALVTPVVTPTVTTAPTATPTAANNVLAEAKLAKGMGEALGEPEVKVQIFIAGDGKKTAVLSGKLSVDEAATAEIVNRAGKMSPLVVDNVISLLVPAPARSPLTESATNAQREEAARKADDRPHRRAEVTALWSRTFSPPPDKSSDSENEKDADAATSDSKAKAKASPESLANILNTFHGAPDDAPYVKTQDSSLLYLKGPREKVVAIKRDLLKLDAAWPQVQLDIWTVQVSGDSKFIAKNAAAIREKFNRANQAMQIVKTLLGDAAQNPQFLDLKNNDNLLEPNNGLLQSIGFDPNCVRPLSLTEKLIFLGLQTVWVDDQGIPERDCRERTYSYQGLFRPWSSFTDNEKKHLARVCTITQLRCKIAKELNRNSELLKALSDNFKTKGQADPEKLLPSLMVAYSSNPASDRAGIVQFAQAAKNFKDETRPILDQEKDIANLRATAAASDRLIKAATDAFASDMQEMFLQPIFDSVSSQAIKTTSGVALTGKARMVVTSRLKTGIEPTVQSFVETTKPKPFDINMLKGFLKDPPASDAAATAGGIPVLGGLLSQPQLLLLGAALNPPETEITRVAPGVKISVRPTVMPDGGSARLQLDFDFGVMTTVSQPSEGKSAMTDGIVSNKVKTDLNISAFELFNVSSFSIESSHPRSRYIPVIGSIPLLGELIKKPPKNKVTRHESIVLVNAVILPRVLDLTHFYGD